MNNQDPIRAKPVDHGTPRCTR